jgi:hypothetical protein
VRHGGAFRRRLDAHQPLPALNAPEAPSADLQPLVFPVGRHPASKLLGIHDTHMTAAALGADVGLVADIVREGPEASAASQ